MPIICPSVSSNMLVLYWCYGKSLSCLCFNCIKLTSVRPLPSQLAMPVRPRKGKAADIEWYQPSDDLAPSAVQTNFRTSLISVDAAGSINTQTSYIPSQSSPNKRKAPEAQWNDDPPPLEPEPFVEAWMDPEYQFALDDSSIFGKRRKRTPGVGFSFDLVEVVTDGIYFQDDPLRLWLRERDKFLAELLRLEGRAGFSEDICRQCLQRPPVVRCKDCCGGEMLCEPCMVSFHVQNPLHRIEVRPVRYQMTFQLISPLVLERCLF
jgi:hypothetical protein